MKYIFNEKIKIKEIRLDITKNLIKVSSLRHRSDIYDDDGLNDVCENDRGRRLGNPSINDDDKGTWSIDIASPNRSDFNYAS